MILYYRNLLIQFTSGLEKNVWVDFVKIALEYQPLNLGQGLPDDLVPEYVVQSLGDVVKDVSLPSEKYFRLLQIPYFYIFSPIMHYNNTQEDLDIQDL